MFFFLLQPLTTHTDHINHFFTLDVFFCFFCLILFFILLPFLLLFLFPSFLIKIKVFFHPLFNVPV